MIFLVSMFMLIVRSRGLVNFFVILFDVEEVDSSIRLNFFLWVRMILVFYVV